MTRKRILNALAAAFALGFGVWTMAVTFSPVVSNFNAGDQLSANAFNALFAAIDANFGAAKTAIEQNETNIAQNAADIAALQTGTGFALPFEGTVNDANTAFDVTNTGTGGAGRFEVDNPQSNAAALTVIGEGQQASLALSVSSFGLGGTALFQNQTFGNDQDVIRSIHGGAGSAGSFETTNSNNSSPALEASSNGSGPAFSATNTGTGFGAQIAVTNPNNVLPALTLSSQRNGTSTLLVTNQAGGSAAFFSGSVTITGALAKGSGSFKIDHPLDPENQYLYHSFVESPDMMNLYNGNVTLGADGAADVTLPAYFEALNMEFRYQLTAIGAPGPNLHIARQIEGNRFTIAGGTPGMQVSWQVTGIRHDPFAEQNRIEVEVPKPAAERGTYLHPAAYGLPPEMGVAAAYQAQADAELAVAGEGR